MKLLTCVCVLNVIGLHFTAAKIKLPDEMLEMIQSLADSCMEQTKVDKELIENAKKTHDLPNDQNFKCFLKCMMVDMQCLTEDGVFDRDAVVEQIPDEIKAMGAVEVMDKCTDAAKGSDPCDKAFNLAKCFAEASKDLIEIFE